ncbi:MAG: hypothetical protein IT423_13210 [Pirellulaceae bacterium]|nr:hypothetical protein [Pirellulaceae bacterium]
MIFRFAILVWALCLTTDFLKADIIVDFGIGATVQNLPYAEDGFTFTNQQGTNSSVIGTPGNTERYLNLSGTGAGSNIAVRLSGSSLFNLNSLDVEGFGPFRDWTFVASNGTVFNVASGTPAQAYNFTSLPGWTNLSHVDFVHSGALANANIRLDNINVTVVPEPASLFFAASVLLVAKRCRFRRRK